MCGLTDCPARSRGTAHGARDLPVSVEDGEIKALSDCLLALLKSYTRMGSKRGGG